MKCIYKFGIAFVAVVVINLFVPFTAKGWSNYFLITHMIIPGIVAVISTIWFTYGGVKDLLRLFRDLKNRSVVDELDDGRVEGNVSVADKKAFEAIEAQAKANAEAAKQ